MGYDARVLEVLIASPGDTSEARDTVERTINSWNRDRSRGQKVMMSASRWEVDAVPEVGAQGEDGQAIINRQLGDQADILVALFNTRLGVPTPRSLSGTVEEIERAIGRGIPVHIYFSEMPIPRDFDPEELERLKQFKEDVRYQALTGSYASMEDLTAQVRTALERDVEKLISAAPPPEILGTGPGAAPGPGAGEPPSGAGAILRARYEYEREPHMDSKGRTHMRTRRERLVIENVGSAPAEHMELAVEGADGGDPPSVHLPSPIERLLPQQSVPVPVLASLGTSNQWRVKLTWREGTRPFDETLTVLPY